MEYYFWNKEVAQRFAQYVRTFKSVSSAEYFMQDENRHIIRFTFYGGTHSDIKYRDISRFAGYIDCLHGE